MDDPVSRPAPEPSPPRTVRGGVLWPGLGVLALLLVTGTAWVRGPDRAVDVQPTPTVQPMDGMSGMEMGAQPAVEHQAEGHTEQAAHEESSASATVQPAVEHQAEGHTEQAAHEESSASATVQPAVEHQAEGHTEQAAHEESSASAGEHEVHGQAGAHEEAPALSLATKKWVLGGFAGANLMAIAAAALLRRRTPPRLPKHLARLQPLRESSLP